MEYSDSNKSQIGSSNIGQADDSSFSELEFDFNPQQPSAKALGKRRQLEPSDVDSKH